LASTGIETRAPSRIHLPPSETVEQPYRVTPRLALRVAVLGVVVLAVFGALVLRLWALQVLSGSQYLRTAENNQLLTLRVQAPRGVILDRRGRVLVTNTAAAGIAVWPAGLPKRYGTRMRELRRLSAIANVPLYEVAARVRKRRQVDPLRPVLIKEPASDAQIDYLAEHAQEFPGVSTPRSYIRHYPYRSLAAQVLGYVGEISPTELKQLRKDGYQLGDEIGQSGVEAAYDKWLRGQPGSAQLRVDSLGRPRSDPTPTLTPQPGHPIRLTLDLGLQEAAEHALKYGIQLARADGQWAARGGAIIAIDPRDGSVRAMASYPTFDPGVYAGRVTHKGLTKAGLTTATAPLRNFPALNRALVATYPPGSTFKPVTALAAMQAHLLLPYEPIECSPDYLSHKQLFKNWDPNVFESIDLPTALAISCDTYFYRVGEKFYDQPAYRGALLQRWAYALGFGKSTPIDIGHDAAGLVPTPAWRRRTFKSVIDRSWKPGNSIQLAIGQGDLLVTPMQMARFYAVLANGGKLVTPHLLLDAENPNGTAVPVPALPTPRPVNLDPSALQAVRLGLYEATHSPVGTSYATFGSFPVSIAGKTGTAEKTVTLPGYSTPFQFDQSWWCGFGPYEKPTLVVCAVIENGGHGGTAAAPAAAQVFAKYFGVHPTQIGAIHSD
jgi:penicillin-binding protein 2